MSDDDQGKWWTREGIQSRWDYEKNTGPPKIIIAKVVREACVPLLIAIIASGVMVWICLWLNIRRYQAITLVFAVFSGVFYFFYTEARFKDSALRGD